MNNKRCEYCGTVINDTRKYKFHDADCRMMENQLRYLTNNKIKLQSKNNPIDVSAHTPNFDKLLKDNITSIAELKK